MTVDLRIVARDPGAASFLAALLRDSALFDGLAADIWVIENIAGYFEDTPFPVTRFDRIPDQAQLRESWAASPARAVITGTSHYEPFDELFWKLGRELGFPTLAVVDYWSNLAQRFERGRPDAIGVIDAEQEREAGQLGLAPLIVTGHPALASIPLADPRAADGRTRLLFISERIADDVAEGVNAPYGFDETDSCRLVLEAARQAADLGIAVEVTVKLHPYNDLAAFRAALGPLPQHPLLGVSLVEGRKPIRPMIEDSDIVTGIASVAMVEAALIGRPVLSIQPGLIRENMFVPGVRGHAETALDAGAAITGLLDLIRDPAARTAARQRLAAFRQTIAAPGGNGIGGWLATALAGHPLETTLQVS